ncbi:MAG: YdcF family protein [Alphaproteobacteria bacterium]|nr:YdcF family protein [Alphaproteobacteria bacterium]
MKFLTFICALLGIWILGLGVFVTYTSSLKSSRIVTEYNAKVCDGVVVFTGKGNRIMPAYAFFQEVGARAFFISGVDEDVQRQDLIQDNTHPDKIIDLGYEAYNTHTNALETAVWMRKNHIYSVCLVTNLYHMPRSLLELKGFVKDKATITPYPLKPRNPWWKHWLSFQFIVSEYHKYLAISLLQMIL